jgi:D-tyrosyl-tRNA(Tyr) deacylase
MRPPAVGYTVTDTSPAVRCRASAWSGIVVASGTWVILPVMRALVQRVIRAEVTWRESVDHDWEVAGAIGHGLCVLVGATHSDTNGEADKLADKLWGLRFFDDDDGVMNRSVADIGGSLLVVSQFTLYGDTGKGRRPSWIAAARPEVAEPLVERVVERLRSLGATVATGRFRTDMRVELVNDGPVTLMLDVDAL